MVDNKRKCSVGLSLLFSLSPSPPRSCLKYFEVDGGTSLLEVVSSDPTRGVYLGLIGLSVAPHPTQHEPVLHSLVNFSYAVVKLPSKRAVLKFYKYGKTPKKKNNVGTEKWQTFRTPLLLWRHLEKCSSETKIERVNKLLICSVRINFICFPTNLLQSSVTCPQIAQKAFSSAGSF